MVGFVRADNVFSVRVCFINVKVGNNQIHFQKLNHILDKNEVNLHITVKKI